jgi:hypothetical protein
MSGTIFSDFFGDLPLLTLYVRSGMIESEAENHPHHGTLGQSISHHPIYRRSASHFFFWKVPSFF